MTPLNHLKQLLLEAHRIKYPTMSDHTRAINTFDTKKREAKNLKRIDTFVNLYPKCTSRIIHNSGIRVDNTKVLPSVVGFQKVGSVTYRKSKNKVGVSDIETVIKGRFVAIELKLIYKNGKDRQSAVQKKHQKEVEEAGGIYKIVNDFNHFYEWFIPFYDKI